MGKLCYTVFSATPTPSTDQPQQYIILLWSGGFYKTKVGTVRRVGAADSSFFICQRGTLQVNMKEERFCARPPAVPAANGSGNIEQVWQASAKNLLGYLLIPVTAKAEGGI